MATSEAIIDTTSNSTTHIGGSSSHCHLASDFPASNWFDDTVIHPAISIPARQVADRKKQLKSLVLQDQKNVYLSQPSIDSEIISSAVVTEVPSPPRSPPRRVLVLRVGVTREDVVAFTPCQDSNEETSDENSLIWIDSFPITRGYSDMSVDEVLRKLLAKETVHEIPSSFELVGHIAHLNLRDDCLPYKYWIGRVILELNQPTIQTVVNKIGTIEADNVFRTFKQEVLAGNSTEPDWSITTVYEHGSCFHLDFRHVYWNSRLSGEHHRLVQLIQKNCTDKFATVDTDDNTINVDERKSFVVADLMAGVGPFAVPLTTTISSSTVKGIKKNCKKDRPVVTPKLSQSSPRITVYANDLNPISYKYLEINAKKNKCFHLHCSNNDAREFLQELQTKVDNIDHVIMNLPATAPEFLDAFRGWTLNALPMVHVHCFGLKYTDSRTISSNNNPIIERCVAALGCSIDDYTITVVRNISPTKNMYCVSFPLPPEARYVNKKKVLNERHIDIEDTTDAKKQKL